MIDNKVKVAFIQGRPHAHPAHTKYAQSVNSDFYYVDYKVRYHDLPGASAGRRYFSWLWSAITFPKKKYDVIFSEEPYFMVGLMKWLGLLRKDQKIVALLNTHTLYFLNHDRFAPSTKKANIKLLNSYDAFICGSLLQKELLYNLIGRENNIPVYTTINGVEPVRMQKLVELVPNLNSTNIVFIGAVTNSNRVWYKGLDLMLAAFNQVKKQMPQLTFTVIGGYDEKLKEELLTQYCPEVREFVFFAGNVADIESYLKKAALYLHISRGEAWGISIIEAMAAGVVPIVSDSTGSMEAVTRADNRLVSSGAITDITHKIMWYFNLPLEEKTLLSQKCREIVVNNYTEQDAFNTFKSRFKSVLVDLGIIKN
ncbi:glycosyltransferase family 4 protein [Rufibacter soli]